MRTLTRVAVLLLMLGGPSASMGTSTLCQIEGLVIGPKAIGWDSVTKLAKYTDSLNETHAGVVTLSRKHDSGQKTNLYFDFGRDYYGITSAEFIVFPVLGGKHRVFGVGYVLVNGERMLTQFLGTYDAVCVTL
jgi:hypothetical protein